MAAASTELSDLREDLIYLILEKLIDNLDDISSCAYVCNSWLSIIQGRLLKQCFPKPLVLQTYNVYKYGDPDLPSYNEEYRLFDTQTRKTHVVKLPELHGGWFRSVSHGWLLTTGFENPHEIKLLNPLTRVRIKLPRPWTKSYGAPPSTNMYRDFRVVMSSNPLDRSCLVLAIHPCSRRWLNYCRPGDKKWSRVHQSGNPIRIHVTLFYKHEFYIIAEEENLYGHDKNGDGYNDSLYRTRFNETEAPTIERLCRLPENEYMQGGGRITYLVELMGDLCLISGNHRFHFECSVHKLEVNGDEHKWVELNSLGENVTYYLDSNGSLLVSASASDECQPNCIYLIDNLDTINVGSYYNCVFNYLEDKLFIYSYHLDWADPSNWFTFQ